MPFDDKNTKKYNSKNLPFKSLCNFIIPFKTEKHYDDKYFDV